MIVKNGGSRTTAAGLRRVRQRRYPQRKPPRREWSTEFKQIALNGQHRFGDDFTLSGKVGISRPKHENLIQTTIIMDKYDVDGYSYDYRGNSRFPTLNYRCWSHHIKVVL